MKTRTGLAILIGAILAAGSAAQSQSGAQAVRSSSSLASGTTLNAELSAPVDSKKAKSGDAVMAHITEAVKADGKKVIPKDAKLVGHVTQASARAKGDPESALGIQFDKAVLKNGQELPLRVWIRAMAAEPRGVYQPGPNQDVATGVGSAAAAGSPMGASRSTMGGSPAAAGPPVGAATHTASGDGGSASAAEKTPGAAGGLNAAGQLTADSRGVFGMDGVHLATDASNPTQGSLITSSGKNVHLDSGTRLLLVFLAEVSTAPNK